MTATQKKINDLTTTYMRILTGTSHEKAKTLADIQKQLDMAYEEKRKECAARRAGIDQQQQRDLEQVAQRDEAQLRGIERFYIDHAYELPRKHPVYKIVKPVTCKNPIRFASILDMWNQGYDMVAIAIAYDLDCPKTVGVVLDKGKRRGEIEETGQYVTVNKDLL